jgi:hypothetical protein
VLRLVGDFSHSAADKGCAFLLAAAIEFFVAFAEAAHVDVKIVDLGIMTHLFFDQVGVFQRIHAAHSGTVFVVVNIPAADAVQQCDAPGRSGKCAGIVAHEDFSTCRDRWRCSGVRIQGGEHIGVAP